MNAATDTKPVSACGPLSRSWPSTNDHPPAVIVNSEARPIDVLAWCHGELTALRGVLRGLSGSSDAIEPDILYDAALHHIEQLPDVLEAVISGMHQRSGRQKVGRDG